jgi:hypothetical protein
MPVFPRASDVAHEAKRRYVPYINDYIFQNQKTNPNLTTGSYLFTDSSLIDLSDRPRLPKGPAVAIVEGDAVDIALDWQETEFCSGKRCPAVNMANASKPGGDWETVTMGPEECFARRSNLASALRTEVGQFSPNASFYPIPSAGGIYSPCIGKQPDPATAGKKTWQRTIAHEGGTIVVFRGAPDEYQVWESFKDLPVISVAPVRRPKLDKTGTNYAFQEERAMMRERMQTILRIAAYYGHQDISLGSFGVGPGFRNPARRVAELWQELLFQEPEFQGLFKNVIFAFDTKRRKGGVDTSAADMDVFNEVFDPFSKYR